MSYPPPPNDPPPSDPSAGHWQYPVQPKEPRATTAMVLGIVGLVGGWMCCVPFAVSPVALVVGQRSLAAIRQQPHLGGRGEALAGFVMGIIGTVLLGLALLVAIGIAYWAINYPSQFSDFLES
jgi:hypothetical protein